MVLSLRQTLENGSNRSCYVLIARLDPVDHGGQRWLHGSGRLSVGKGTTHQRHRSGIESRKGILFISPENLAFYACRLSLGSSRNLPPPRLRDEQGRVVRKPVNANPGLKVNRSNNFSSIKMLSTAYVLCTLRLLMLKTEGQKI